MSNYILRKGKSVLTDLADGGAVYGYPGAEYPGKQYFVNNISGASGNSGDNWSNAMSQVSTAITAWEAYRAAITTNNQYVRGQIFVQGTGTAYTALTALPLHCDIIGIGCDPRGNGTGIPTITSGAAADAVDSSVTIRGLRVYNMQFSGGGAYYSLDMTALFRGGFYNCAFLNCTSGVRIVTGGAITFSNCHFGGDTTTPTTALAVGTSGGNFNQSLIEDCMFYASTTGFAMGAYLADGSLMRNCTLYGGTYGIRDTSTETTVAGNMFYVGNYAAGGTAGISIASTGNAAVQCMGNFTSDAGENHIYSVPVVTTST